VLHSHKSGVLGVYGPFLEQGGYRCVQNKHFDESLRSRSTHYQIRDQSEMIALVANTTHLRHHETVDLGEELLLIFAAAGPEVH